ncbi:MAG: LysM peptidoglycan-binding domain-containing protein [Spongiibacteraceae bacterium]
MKINKLKYIVNIISGLFLLSSCALINSIPFAKHEPIEINDATASELIENQPWDYSTNFDSPYICIPGEDTGEPAWVEPETIWQRIKSGSQLDWQIDESRIDTEFNRLQSNPLYMNTVSQRAERYIYHITESLDEKGLPLELALLPIVESAYDPFAYSHGRASGMWQFIPSTGRMYKLEQNWWYDGRRDIIDSTNAAISLLENLNNYYEGDWLLALAAYNAGQGNVNRAIRKNQKAGKPTDFWSLDLPRETKTYVPKLLALAKLIDNPTHYGLDLEPIPNSPYFAEIETHSQIDLAQVASMASIDIDELYRLNPGFNRWATSPDGPHRLLIPIESEPLLEQQISSLDPQSRLNWKRYKVKSGDSLLLLAKRFNTDANVIKDINSLSSNTIKVGQSLMIPTATEQAEHYSLSANQRLTAIQTNRTGGANSTQQFHNVRSGDSLWTIARKYNVTVAKLAHWNGIAPKDPLKPGQKLSIWVNQAGAVQPGQRESVIRKVGYKVRSGDSLARIAGKFNVGVNDIIKWNNVNPKKYLQPGQAITLYVDVTNRVN